jgi:divalent metal cation (Fe/Co/Zn/Cd) transporter
MSWGSADVPLVVGRAATLPTRRASLVRGARLLAWSSVAWHVLEASIAVGAGLAASSVALVGFGADSLIEALAGVAVLWRFADVRAGSAAAERRAQLVIGASFFVLAAYIAAGSIVSLAVGYRPTASAMGIALAIVTSVTMPLLARAKQRLGSELGSRATASEGRQNMLCAYLSLALLACLAGNALFGLWWLDPVTALAIAAVALREGRQSWRGCGYC